MKRFVSVLLVLCMLLPIAAFADDDAWICPNCLIERTTKFCPVCRASRDDVMAADPLVELDDAGRNYLEISWSGFTGVKEYKVYISAADASDWSLLDKTEDTSYTIMDLASGTAYDIRVRGDNKQEAILEDVMTTGSAAAAPEPAAEPTPEPESEPIYVTFGKDPERNEWQVLYLENDTAVLVSRSPLPLDAFGLKMPSSYDEALFLLQYINDAYFTLFTEEERAAIVPGDNGLISLFQGDDGLLYASITVVIETEALLRGEIIPKVPAWGEWSDWSDAAAEPSEGTQVETATLYRTRTIAADDQYSGWSEWSDWGTDAAAADDLTEVEERTEYRSRTITEGTQYSDWGEWSDWSGSKVAADELTDVETRTEYRSRTITNKPEYGAWSSWSTTAVSASNTRDVDTKTESEPVYSTVTKYNYNRWVYDNNDGNTYFSYAQYTGPGYKGNGHWQYHQENSALGVVKTINGHKQYVGMWYNESTSTEKVQTGTKQVTYYRSRTVTYKTEYGSWGSWSGKAVSKSSKLDVSTRTAYRSRTRTMESTATMGEWSSWDAASITASDSLEVDTRTVYRTRTRTQETMPNDGEWSEWSEAPVQPSAEIEVETKTVYRTRTLK